MKPLLILLSIIFIFSSCKVNWEESEKNKILNDCRLAAEKYGFTDPEKHCDCVLRSIINRYPNPNQMENMEMGEFGEIVSECQGREIGTRIIWPEKMQKAFLDSCNTMAASQKKNNPDMYCKCVLTEIIRRYPTDDSIAGLKPAEMLEIGISCEN